MKFAHQSATIRQHGKGMIILETALETAGLTYIFPDGNGIKNIAFQVKRGEIYALYGGHHAGKSVLLQTIIGTLRPQAGTLKLFGNIDYQKERRRIGFVPQKPVTIGSLSPADMLRLFFFRFWNHRNPYFRYTAFEPEREKGGTAIAIIYPAFSEFGCCPFGKSRYDNFGRSFFRAR